MLAYARRVELRYKMVTIICDGNMNSVNWLRNSLVISINYLTTLREFRKLAKILQSYGKDINSFLLAKGQPPLGCWLFV